MMFFLLWVFNLFNYLTFSSLFRVFPIFAVENRNMMSTISIILLFLFAIGASFVQRVTGFGFGIFIMTVLPYLMPSYGESTTLSGLLASVTSLIIVLRMYKYIHWKRLLPILMTFLVVSFFAVKSVEIVGDGTLKRVLGVVLILVSLYFYFLSHKIEVKPTFPIQVGMGTLSGAMGGFFGMQGPPAVLYFLALNKTKEEYVANTQCYFLLGNLAMTMYRADSGYLTTTVGEAWCYGLLGVFIGTTLGAKVFHKLSGEVLRKVIYIYIGISGLVALFS